jgi:hypothetical protein
VHSIGVPENVIAASIFRKGLLNAKTIDDYHFPVVTLSDKTEPDALCTIFETLNRTGVKLCVFEWLTARF